MAKLKVRVYPDEVLLKKAAKISRIDTSVRKLAADMLDTMYEYNGVGLAAPQIGVSKRLFVIDVADEDGPRKPIVFVNPEIIESEGELIGLEGCLSFPEVYFEVRRFSRVVVRYQNLNGQFLKMEAANNLLCRAIQHELDHLDGVLFINKPVSKLACDLELSKYGFVDIEAEENEQIIDLKAKTKAVL